MIEVKTHGKLYIAGEYQVLNSGGNAIIFGMNRYMHFKIDDNDNFLYVSRGKAFNFTYENKTFTFANNNKIVNEAIKTTFEYLNDNKIIIKPFKIDIKSELETNNGTKYGFGSSSAVITGIIKVILLFHEIQCDEKLIFKLAVIAQIKGDVLTSGGDLAAALYGGYLYYERYDLEFVLNNIDNNNLMNLNWPMLLIEPINAIDINVMAIWTNESYKTKPLNKEITKKLYKYANRLVKVLKAGLEKGKFKLINKAISAYDQWLKAILKDTNRYINSFNEINDIAKKHGLSSKLSGAGGGDSAIVIYKLEQEVKLTNDYLQQGYRIFTF